MKFIIKDSSCGVGHGQQVRDGHSGYTKLLTSFEEEFGGRVILSHWQAFPSAKGEGPKLE